MGLITLQSRECIREVSPVIADELERIAAAVNTGWAVQHLPTGVHTTEVIGSGGLTATDLVGYVRIYLGGSRYHGVQVT